MQTVKTVNQFLVSINTGLKPSDNEIKTFKGKPNLQALASVGKNKALSTNNEAHRFAKTNFNPPNLLSRL